MLSIRPPLAVVTALLIGSGLVGCKPAEDPPRGGEPAADEPVAVVMAPVQVRSVTRTVDVTGTLFGDEQATLSAKVGGRVRSVLHDLGDLVQAGAPIIEIDPTDYELAAEQRRTALQVSLAQLGLDELPGDEFDPDRVPTVTMARAEAANAGVRFERARTLFEQTPPLISEQDYADLQTAAAVAESAYEVALMEARSRLAEARTSRAELAQAQQALADTTVRAPGEPGDGRRYALAERLVSVGEYIQQGDPLVRVVVPDPIKFRAAVPERYLGQIATGQRVAVFIDAYKQSFDGTISRVAPQISPESRTFQIEVEIANPDGRLTPGGFGRGEVAVGEDPGVRFVPENALVSFAGTTKVYTVRDGKAVEHRVTAGRPADGYAQVSGDLGGSELVVVSGAAKLAPNTPVRVTTAPAGMASPAPSANAARPEG